MKIIINIKPENTIEIKTNELLPCPFCGNDNIGIYRNGNSHYAYCHLCRSRAQDFPVSTSREIVINSWNKRSK